jgi:hypothetical protein
MTDVVDRLDAPTGARREPLGTELPEPYVTPGRGADATSPSGAVSLAGRILLAALSIGAALIHFVMVPDHMEEWTAEGVGFALAGWAQVLLALWLLARPGRRVLVAMIVANGAFLATWAVSRTTGLPFGPHEGVAEPSGLVDLTCVAFEGAIVAIAAVLAVRPSMGSRLRGAALVPFSILPLAVLVLATAVITSPAARDHAHAAPVDDKGFSLLANGHQEERGEVALDPGTQVTLDAQLAGTRQFEARYPTVADAVADGYRQAGPFSPGLGTHFIKPAAMGGATAGVMTDEWLGGAILIYDGVSPDSKLAGYMYQSLGSDQPEGFAGPNDHWHYHTNVCIVFNGDGTIDAPLGADVANVPKEVCDLYGGRLLEDTGYMVHVWTVPGYENPDGVFAELNPALTCPDGTYYQIPVTFVGNRDTTCPLPGEPYVGSAALAGGEGADHDH